MRIRRQLSAHSLVFPVFCFTPAPSHHFLLLAEDEGCQDRKALNRLGIPEIEQQVRLDSSHFSTHRAGKPVSHFERQVLKISPRSAIQASRIREPAIVRPQSDLRISEISLPFMALGKICGESFEMAHPRGFEPLASAFGGQRSIRLSYGCAEIYPYANCSKIANLIMRTGRGRIQVLPPICRPHPLYCKGRTTRGRSRSFPNVPSMAGRNDGQLEPRCPFCQALSRGHGRARHRQL